MRKLLILTIMGSLLSLSLFAQNENPVKVGIVGLTHSHVHWLFNREDRNDIEIVGIVEPNVELAQRFADQYDFSLEMVYGTMKELAEKTKSYQKEKYDMIPVEVAAVIKENPNKDGWEKIIEIKEIISVSDQRKASKLKMNGIQFSGN